jgi:uncharacterized protein YbjT (DUF2867 family)
VARALIVGCGCRGGEVGRELLGRGWEVRGTSRVRSGLGRIAAAGIEPAEADPEKPGTVLGLCGDVGVVVWLLGSAVGGPELISAIHGPRLERLMEKLVDSPVRGVAYEAVGSAAADLLAAGGEIVREAGERWHIPVTTISTPRDAPGWAESCADRIAGLLA